MLAVHPDSLHLEMPWVLRSWRRLHQLQNSWLPLLSGLHAPSVRGLHAHVPRAFCRADVRPTEAPCALNRVSCYLQDALCLLLSTDDDASECGSRSFSCLRVIELLGFRWAFAIKWGWFGPLFFQILFQPLSDLGTPVAHRLVHLVASSRSLKLCSFSFAVFFFFFLFLQCDALSWAVFQRPLPAPILSLHFHRTRSMLSSE